MTRRGALIAILFASAPAVLSAHGFAERYDLPLPLWFYITGAGAAIALSFVVAGRYVTATQEPSPQRARSSRRTPFGFAILAAGQTLAVALFLAAIAAGFIGVQGEPIENLLPVTVWVLWWVGVTYTCALAGDVWSLVNPVTALARWTARLVGREAPATLRFPSRWTGWPAVVLFFLFQCAEIAWPSNAVPFKLAVAVSAYAVMTWIAMAAFGIDRWLAVGDPFARFFGLVSGFAPFDVQTKTRRPFGAGLVALAPLTKADVAFVMLVLAGVTFDGVRETPFWSDLSGWATNVLYLAGWLAVLGNVWANALLKVLGLALLSALFLAVYLLTCRLSAAMAGRVASRAPTARLFAASLIPIAIAYHLAHYLSYLLIQGQAVIGLASDPLGLGWNLFGTRGYEPDPSYFPARLAWVVVVSTIVAGHVAAVIVAHVTALRAFTDRRAALASQYPMLGLMVGYTMVSLWILSQPIVKH